VKEDEIEYLGRVAAGRLHLGSTKRSSVLMVSLLASAAFSTRVSRYAFRSSNVSNISWVEKVVGGMVLLVLLVLT